MNISIAQISDALIIAQNNVLMAKESEHQHIEYATTLSAVKTVLTDKSKGFYLLAKEQESVIGQLMITYEWSDWRNKNIWWIQSVYVHPNYRRKGVFQELFSQVIHLGTQNNVDMFRLYVHYTNAAAIKAYEKINMKHGRYLLFEYQKS